MRRLSGFLVAVAFVALVGCTPTTTGGGTGSTTTTTSPANLRTCPTPAAGQVRVAVVVAFNTTSTPTSVVCVVVPSGSSGSAALVARAVRLGTALPRYNSSGLLCAIDGTPAAPACGDPVGGSFAYWSYWIGGSTWTYATVGPATHGVFDGDVEGWGWTASGTATAPPTSPSFAALTS